MVRPIVPIIEYHANYDYIATVLCENKDKPYLACNGKCYLEKQLEKVNHNNHDHKSNIPQIDLEKYPVSPIGEYTYKFKTRNYNAAKCMFVDCNNAQEVFNSLLKPPQFIS